MAHKTNGKALDDSQGTADVGDTSAPLDVEAAKRNLQALVAAGMHAHGLLGHDNANGGEYMSDEDDGDDQSSSDRDHGGEEEDEDDEEEVVASGQVTSRSFAQQHDMLYEGSGNGGAASGGGSILDMHPSSAEYYFGGNDEMSRHNYPADDEESHQALLSRVASNFRALIGHGLTAAGGRAEGIDGYGDSAALDDGEAYELACATLEGNLRYQRLLRTQLAAIDTAQRRNKELQESIGTLLTIQARATNRRSGRRNRDDRTSQIDPVTNELKIAASSYFVDCDNSRPGDNRDTVRKKKHPPIVYRARRWTDAEREALVRGVRQSNRKLMLQKLYQQNTDPRTIWNADKVSDQELEMNLMGVDWKFISKQFVPQHKPVECAIQYATQDHPIINREPWTKKEERTLYDIVQRYGGRDWVNIAKELDTQRTAAQCFQVYQRKLNPDMSRSKWTPEEDQLLHEAVMTYGEGDWQAVASCLDNRTGQQVLHRWCKSINPAIRSGRWDRDEDVALLAAVRLYGVGQWTKIAKHVPGRTDVKCRERYMNVLTPDVNNTQWTAAEDARLIAIVNRVGIGKWSYVADLLGNRTDNQCWRHWRSLNKKGKAPEPPKDLEDESGEEGTVPSFPEWEEERRRRQSQPNADQDDEALLSFAHTQGNGRKRKTSSGIESARKRQWKRATSTNFVPLLPQLELDLPHLASPNPASRNTAARAASTAAQSIAEPTTPTPTRGRAGRPPRNRLSLPANDQSEGVASPTSRRSSAMRRGRVLNWTNLLQVGVEAKDPDSMHVDAHLRPVLPCLGTVQGLQRLLEAVPDAGAAFNAELMGIDEDEFTPPLDSVQVNCLRQRIEALFIWPLMLGTLDIQGNRK
ncbi:hypothetical protein IWW38_001032 [Coemansia aciculifera]|uniref:Uncharacterized protein n=1 Tax=Coemansia aciculifera TaxID=417176 RepID=A0ACC1M809_9FUNG|nr:hypothetical protein IWW38_001032 [Coemansia aciculifera]